MTDTRGHAQQLPDPLTHLAAFLHQERVRSLDSLSALSLFSGAGLGDLGYERAGFRFHVQSELDDDRASLAATNFLEADIVVGPLSEQWGVVAALYHQRRAGRLQLLSATPPCQGMSSSNPGRGKVSASEQRDARNRLLLDVIPIVQALQPRIVVAENVMQVLQETVQLEQQPKKVIDAFREGLHEYEIFTGVVQMADYGVPQMRKRAIIVGVHRDEPCLTDLLLHGLLPWPRTTHIERSTNGLRPWVTLEAWLTFMNYSPLDAQDEHSAHSETDPLHVVPHYGDEPHRYFCIADIPARSGRNGYQNANCRSCGRLDVPECVAHCPYCAAPMINRPYVCEADGTFRLIKGFESSYRRMYPDRPAPTITTASSHVGSDYKVHPWENRVLSIRECADLQTVPRFYDWSWSFQTKHIYVARQVIGEALPPWFTYLHGCILRDLLASHVNANVLARSGTPPRRQ